MFIQPRFGSVSLYQSGDLRNMVWYGHNRRAVFAVCLFGGLGTYHQKACNLIEYCMLTQP